MFELENYGRQSTLWPAWGRHILAQFDEESIVVYSAFNPKIARFAVQKQRFGGHFSFERMSWIKPNFLWMQYRSGWNTKPNQERTLAIRVPLELWEEMLLRAVPSSFVNVLYPTESEWKIALQKSEVRVQWDPDHGPRGEKLQRRAVQIGLRGEFLHRYSEENLGIEDVTEIVEAGRAQLNNRDLKHLETPRERVYTPKNAEVARRLNLDFWCSEQEREDKSSINMDGAEANFWAIMDGTMSWKDDAKSRGET